MSMLTLPSGFAFDYTNLCGEGKVTAADVAAIGLELQAAYQAVQQMRSTGVVRGHLSKDGEAARSTEQGLDQSIPLTRGRLLQTVGNLHLYEFFLPADVLVGADLSATLLLGEEVEPTEGIVLFQDGERLVLP